MFYSLCVAYLSSLVLSQHVCHDNEGGVIGFKGILGESYEQQSENDCVGKR